MTCDTGCADCRWEFHSTAQKGFKDGFLRITIRADVASFTTRCYNCFYCGYMDLPAESVDRPKARIKHDTIRGCPRGKFGGNQKLIREPDYNGGDGGAILSMKYLHADLVKYQCCLLSLISQSLRGCHSAFLDDMFKNQVFGRRKPVREPIGVEKP